MRAFRSANNSTKNLRNASAIKTFDNGQSTNKRSTISSDSISDFFKLSGKSVDSSPQLLTIIFRSKSTIKPSSKFGPFCGCI